MADITEYKCPACGGAMEFNTGTQSMKCPYCDTEMSIEEFKKLYEQTPLASAPASVNSEADDWESAGDGQWKEGEAEGLIIYGCESCGGEIIAKEQSGAFSCPYCGNRIVIKKQFSGDLKPDYVIPFQYDKKAAKQAYKRHLKGKSFLPHVFKDENHINEIKGIYVPFWLFDASAEADIDYDGTSTRIWIAGDIEYTEYKKYHMERSGEVKFQSIPADGSRSIDDALMEAIEPFDFNAAVEFSPEYLAGFMADRYDVQKDERLERIKERVIRSVEDSFERTLPQFNSIRKLKCDIRLKHGRYAYALYPVWLLSTSWRGQNYLFAMNGQTGKMVGDLPADKRAFWQYVGTVTVISAVIIHLISMVVMRL